MTAPDRGGAPPVALTIAGSDSGGGAGIQADLRTFAALGVFATTAITAVTAQNTVGVHRVDVLDLATVDAQIDAVLSDLGPSAVKTGMLATAAIVDLVAGRASTLPQLVVDPVMVASSGDRLLDPDAEIAYRDRLLPQALVATPNLLEAGALVGRELGDVEDMHGAAAELAERGAEWVVVKGGHLAGAADDVVHHRGHSFVLRSARVDTGNNHGTGCSFAAAVAAGLASGLEPEIAIRRAKDFVTRGIIGATRWRLGAGHGPIDHFGWSS
jgi:hydroxymethylpyrimidine/phosphomethylpyrimidine kinase